MSKRVSGVMPEQINIRLMSQHITENMTEHMQHMSQHVSDHMGDLMTRTRNKNNVRTHIRTIAGPSQNTFQNTGQMLMQKRMYVCHKTHVRLHSRSKVRTYAGREVGREAQAGEGDKMDIESNLYLTNEKKEQRFVVLPRPSFPKTRLRNKAALFFLRVPPP